MEEGDLARRNHELAGKFARVEARLTACASAVSLLEGLVLEIEEVFGVPFVWLTLLDTAEASALRGMLARSPRLKDRLNVLTPAAFLAAVPETGRPLLASGDLRSFYRLLPPTCKYLIRSVAVSPLCLHGRLIGSLNLGDASPERYEPGMDTTRLEQLARTVSGGLAQRLPPLAP
jgi:uncharacterized protein YigA (DUF484 family)